eukprot:COSAG02_NODE_270_length_26392_cov_29.151980_16_plen_455_part_00
MDELIEEDDLPLGVDGSATSGGNDPVAASHLSTVWLIAVGPAVVTVMLALVLAVSRRPRQKYNCDDGSSVVVSSTIPARDEPWMWITRGLYFLDGFATSFWSPLGATILVRDCGLSPSSVGLVMATCQIASIPTPTAITNFADRTGRHTVVFRAIIFVPILVSVCLLYEVWHIHTSALLLLVGVTLVLQAVTGNAAITPMLSGATMTRLSALGTPERFGRFMVFRALGWSSGSALAGVVYQLGLHLHLGSILLDVPGAPAVILCGLIGCRGLQLLLALQVSLPSSSDASQQQNDTAAGDDGATVGRRQSLRSFLLNAEVIVFFLCMAINGVAGATYDNFVVLFAKQKLDASGYVLGLLTTATGIANTLMWWIQPYMIKSLGSRLTLCVAMSSTVVRCVLYTIATEPWQVVAIQLLHGVSWVCIWSGGTAFAHEMAPPHLKSTAQGILNSVYGGV